jgi:hypothetical protein
MRNVRERKILRKILGAKKEGNEWKIRNNQELRNMYGQPEIIRNIKSQRLGTARTCGKDGGGSNGEKDI